MTIHFLPRNTILFLSGLALISCTSSTQANRAMEVGGTILGLGSAVFLIGYASSVDENPGNNAWPLIPLGGVISSAGFWTLVVGAISKPPLVNNEALQEQISGLSSQLEWQGIAIQRNTPESSSRNLLASVPRRIPSSPHIDSELTNELGYLTLSVPCYGPLVAALKIYSQDGDLLHVIRSDLERDNYYYFPIDQTFIDLESQDISYEVCNRILEYSEFLQIPSF
jgi:hypothetical protein